MTTRILLSMLTLALFTACEDKPITVDDTDTTGDTDTDTEDSGDTELEVVWQSVRAETADTFNGVYASGRGVYAVSSEAGLWVYTSSTGWSREELEVEEEDLNAIWGQGQNETLRYTAVGNAGWVVQHADSEANFEAVGATNPDFIVAVGWGGVYTWSGLDWVYETLPSNERLNDVWVAGTSAIAVGEEGAIVRREAGGWVPMTSPTDEALYGIGGAADNNLWAVGQDGLVLHFDGTTWTEQESFTSQSLWAVYAPQANSVYVVGNNGTAFKYDGQAWRQLLTGIEENLYAVHGSGATDCWAVGNRGTALHYTGG
jgi:hypothetical protein